VEGGADPDQDEWEMPIQSARHCCATCERIPPEFHLKHQVSGARQLNLGLRPRREERRYRCCSDVAGKSLFCRCYLAVIVCRYLTENTRMPVRYEGF
jgi:hypothetical protein